MIRTMTIAAVVLTTTLAWAQAPANDPHHPQGAAPAPAQPAPPHAQSGAPGTQGMMGGMPMMDMTMMRMMRDMSTMHMMGMMRQMGMTGPGGMAMIERVEGRIAFLRAELKITDAQTSAWNAFADALRVNAKKLADARSAAMGHHAGGPQTLTQRLDTQEQWLIARLDGTRALKSTFATLSAALSDEQRKSADELLDPHMGLAMMPPAQMPSR